jgi:leucine dehydrogenase
MDESALKRVVDEFGVQVIGMDDIYAADLDIYAPCALGATLNEETIPNLK